MTALRRRPAAILSGAALLLALALTACTGAPAPTATPTAPTQTTTASPTPTASAGPVLVPGGTAAQNLAFFDQVNRATVAAKPGAGGRDIIDALVAAGFRKSDMQLTPDKTTIGLDAGSIQFSVQFGDSCVVGQYGAAGYFSMTSATLATGGCLIGQTRPIDW